MKDFKSIAKLTDAFQRLPGIGHKTAEKMAFQSLELPEETIKQFSSALLEVKNKIHHCPICGSYTESEICDICSNELRDGSKILVVSYAKDVIAFERVGVYDGKYHVLNGVLSSLNGITVNDLNIEPLLKRIKEENIQEIIIATNPNLEGETTALYLAKVIAPLNVKVTRIAYGLPLGSHLEYADALTLSKALEGRNKI